MIVKMSIPAGSGYAARTVSVDFHDLLDVIKFSIENTQNADSTVAKVSDDLFCAVGYPDREVLNGRVELTVCEG